MLTETLTSSEMKSSSRAPFYVRRLKFELATRKRRNPRYSLRAFARSLRLDPAALCRVFRGRQALSPKACPGVLLALAFSLEDQNYFVVSVLLERNLVEYETIMDQIEETAPLEGDPSVARRGRFLRELFPLFEKEQTSAVLAACEGSGLEFDSKAIGVRCRMSESQAEWIVLLLIRGGLLTEMGGRLRCVVDSEQRRA